MARIIGSIASSHTPTIGYAYDQQKQTDPAWAPIFEAYAPVQSWLLETKPDVVFYIFNDHVTSFFFDHYSAFALGIGDSYASAVSLRTASSFRDMGYLAGPRSKR